MKITDATWNKCDSCACYYDASGNCQSEQPHRADINSEAGVCPQCELTLTRLGVAIVQKNLLAGREAFSTETENLDKPQRPGFADDANRLPGIANNARLQFLKAA